MIDPILIHRGLSATDEVCGCWKDVRNDGKRRDDGIEGRHDKKEYNEKKEMLRVYSPHRIGVFRSPLIYTSYASTALWDNSSVTISWMKFRRRT